MERIVSKSALVLVALFSLSYCKYSTLNQNDLSQDEGGKIRIAMLSGDVSLLPACEKTSCLHGKRDLFIAAAMRIEGNLAASTDLATRCLALSRARMVIHYTCARILNMDAKDKDGLYGDWSTIDKLADAVEPLYRNHVFGKEEDYSSSYLNVRRRRLRSLKIPPESTVHISSAASVPLVGHLRSSVFVDKESRVSKVAQYLYPSVPVLVNGVPLILQVDTGSQTTTLTASAARRAGVKSVEGLRENTQSLTGKVMVVRPGIARTLKFANVLIANKSVQIVPDSSGKSADLGDGTLGLDAIRKLNSFEITKNSLVVGSHPPPGCNGDLGISSDINSGGVLGLVLLHSTFNHIPVVALLDTGNAIAGVIPTAQLGPHHGIEVKDRHLLNVVALGGYSTVASGYVDGTFGVLGSKYKGKMEIAASFPGTPIDFDIGMPVFGGEPIFVDLDRMKICRG